MLPAQMPQKVILSAEVLVTILARNFVYVQPHFFCFESVIGDIMSVQIAFRTVRFVADEAWIRRVFPRPRLRQKVDLRLMRVMVFLGFGVWWAGQWEICSKFWDWCYPAGGFMLPVCVIFMQGLHLGIKQVRGKAETTGTSRIPLRALWRLLQRCHEHVF